MNFKTGERIKIVHTDPYRKKLLGKTGYIVCEHRFDFMHFPIITVIIKLDKKVYGSYEHAVSLDEIERDDQ